MNPIIIDCIKRLENFIQNKISIEKGFEMKKIAREFLDSSRNSRNTVESSRIFQGCAPRIF